jgi:riboflavin synthase
MFTGIVQELGETVSLIKKTPSARLLIKSSLLTGPARIGDSIAINGVCLTVVEKKGDTMAFDLSDETLKASNLGELRPGDKINLEPALKAQDPLGGHLVSGHVDAVGRMRSKKKEGEGFKLEIEAPPQVLDFLVEKGSVAVDGISLTVVDVLRDSFTVVIIPHTAAVTTLGAKGASSTLNLEADIIGKYVAKFVGRMKSGGLKQSLLDAGFIKD